MCVYIRSTYIYVCLVYICVCMHFIDPTTTIPINPQPKKQPNKTNTTTACRPSASSAAWCAWAAYSTSTSGPWSRRTGAAAGGWVLRMQFWGMGEGCICR